jgi:phospholipid transport system substrate-binding protein
MIKSIVRVGAWLTLALCAVGVANAGSDGAATSTSSAASAMGPQEIVENSAKRMLRELDANRSLYANDSAKLDGLVGDVLLPNFDTEYAARLVLGQTWRTATAEQRKRFVDAFYHSLLKNYGAALVNFTADRLVIFPYKGEAAETAATVRTEVKRSNGERVPVNFSLRKTASGWKAWDVNIEGISYVRSFKTDFGTEIEQKGLDEVIQRLESEAAARPKAVGHSD